METNKSLMDIINTGSVCYIKNWTSEDVSCKHTKVEFSIGEENLRNIDNQESKDYQFVHKETENMVKSFARSIISDKDSKLILSIKVAPIFHVEDARKVQQIAQTREYFGVKIPESIAMILSLQKGEIVPGDNKVVEVEDIYDAVTEDSKKYLMEYLNAKALGE